MKVNVRFFASLRDEIEVDSLEIDLDGDGSREALFKGLSLVLNFDQMEKLCSTDVSIAVNQTIQKEQLQLRHNDEVAFLPPITGG